MEDQSKSKPNPNLAKAFSKFTISKIKAIGAMADACVGTSSSIDLSEELNKTDQNLGGILSSLARTKIDGKPLITPLAKEPGQGTIWKLNENIAPRKEIKDTVDNILSEVEKWRRGK